jgi:hypothetical protein
MQMGQRGEMATMTNQPSALYTMRFPTLSFLDKGFAIIVIRGNVRAFLLCVK